MAERYVVVRTCTVLHQVRKCTYCTYFVGLPLTVINMSLTLTATLPDSNMEHSLFWNHYFYGPADRQSLPSSRDMCPTVRAPETMSNVSLSEDTKYGKQFLVAPETIPLKRVRPSVIGHFGIELIDDGTRYFTYVYRNDCTFRGPKRDACSFL